MNIFIKHTIRNIKGNKFKSMLILLSLMLTTIILYLNMSIKEGLIESFEYLYRQTYQDYDILMTSKENLDGGVFEEKDINLDSIIYEKSLLYNIGFGVLVLNERENPVHILGCDREKLIDENLCQLEEEEVFGYEEDEQIIVSKEFAKRNDVKLGDTLEVVSGGINLQFRVVAIAKNTGLFTTEGGGILIIATKNLVSELKYYRTCFLVDVPDDIDLETTLETIKRENKMLSCTLTIDDDMINNSLGIFSSVLLMLLLFIVLLSVCLISSVFKSLIYERYSVMGTFRSIGATQIMVEGIQLLESILYGAIGGILGIITAVLIQQPVMNMITELIGNSAVNKVKVNINITYLIVCILFSILISVACSIFHILKSSKKEIKDAIFNKISVKQNNSVGSFIVGCVLILISIILYFMNVNYNMINSLGDLIVAIIGGCLIIPVTTKGLSFLLKKSNVLFGSEAQLGAYHTSACKNVNANIVLLSVVNAVIILIYMLGNSIGQMFSDVQKSFDSEIQISGFTSGKADYEYLKNAEGVKDIQYMYYAMADCNGKQVYFMGLDKASNGIQNIAGNIASLEEGEAMIDENYAKLQDLSIGDEIVISSSYFKKEKANYTLVGYVDSSKFTSYGNTVVIDQATYEKNVSDNISIGKVSVKEGYDSDTVKSNLNKIRTSDLQIVTVDEYVEEQKATSDGLLMMVYFILTLSLVLTAIGIVNNQFLGFLMRKKEFAVMYSVAMSKYQIKKMIMFELIDTFVISSIIGSIFGLYWLKLLERVLFSFGLFIEMNLIIIHFFAILVILFIALMCTGLLPIKLINKLEIVKELKYE